MNTRTVICLTLVGTSLVVGRTAHADVTFCNNSGEEIWTAFASDAPGDGNGPTCNGTVFPQLDYLDGYVETEVRGWFALNQSGCVTVFRGNLENNNREFYYFATNSNWSTTWGGGWSTAVENPGFDLCNPYGIVSGAQIPPSPYFVEGFGNIGTGNYTNYTLTFGS
jgi:uncharacterized membrane protein